MYHHLFVSNRPLSLSASSLMLPITGLDPSLEDLSGDPLFDPKSDDVAIINRLTLSETRRPLRLSDAGDRILAQMARREKALVRVPGDLDWMAEIAGGQKAALAALERLAKRGRLVHVRLGIWVARTETGTLPLGALELVGAVAPKAHLVTAGRALAEHGLSDQSFRTIIVATETGGRPWTWQGESVRYARLPAARIWGGAPLRRAGVSVEVASAERALLDSLAHPDWGVSLAQAVEALDRLLGTPRGAERLALATRRYDNANLARRVGFLVSRLGREDEARAFLALRGTSRAAILLAPKVDGHGPLDSVWRVRENVPVAQLLDHGIGG
jgi:predicted transcriptional regulator of viral defense system